MIRSAIRHGFFHLLSANFLIQFMGFGTLLIVPQFVSTEELGVLKIIQTYAGLFMILAGFGFNNAVLKLGSERRPDEEKTYFLKAALLRSTLTAGLSYGLMAALALTGVISASQEVGIWLLAYGLLLPFDAWTLILSAYLQAQKKIREMARAQLMVKLQSVVVVVVATWQFGFRGFIYATVAAYAIGVLPFLRQTGVAFLRARPRPLPSLFHEMSRFSVLANGVNTLGRHADLYVLGLVYQDPIEVGLYALAKIFMNGANVVTSSMQRIVFPLLSEGDRDEAWFRSNARRAQWQTSLISVVVAFGVHFAALLIIPLYRTDYSGAMVYLDILLLKYVLWSSFAIFGVSIMSLGRPRYNLAGALISTPVALAVTYVMLRQFGTVGVAWAQVVAHAFQLPVLFILYRLAARKHFGSL